MHFFGYNVQHAGYAKLIIASVQRCGACNYRKMFNGGILKAWYVKIVHETYSTRIYKHYGSARLLRLYRTRLTSESVAVEFIYKNIAIICIIRN